MKTFEVVYRCDGERRWHRRYVRARDEHAVDRHFAYLDEYDCREVDEGLLPTRTVLTYIVG